MRLDLEPVSQKRQILVRVLLSVQTLMVVCIALFEPLSLNYQMVQTGGLATAASLAVLSVLAMLSLADVLINDVLPRDWRLPFGHNYRHLLWGCMACTYAAYVFVLARQNTGFWLAGTFAVYATGCMAIAFFDLRHRALE